MLILIEILSVVLVSSQSSVILSFIVAEISIISLIFLHLAKGKTFLEYIGKIIMWYYLIALFGFFITGNSVYQLLQGMEYGLYNFDDYMAIFFNYIFGIGITILILVFFVFYEYNILKQKQLELKNTYSHDLGNILQSILSATELMKLNEEEDHMKLIREKSKEAADLINKIKKLE